MGRRDLLVAVSGFLATGFAGCTSSPPGDGPGSPTPEPTRAASATPGAALSLGAETFDDGGTIPTRYTCSGDDVSPALSIGGVPDGVTALAIVVDDPDAPGRTFTHWLLWALEPGVVTIPKAVSRGRTVDGLSGARQGTNDAGVVGYSGPCPPRGDQPHTYRFRLLALDEPLGLEPGATRTAFDDALAAVSHAEAVLRGTFGR